MMEITFTVGQKAVYPGRGVGTVVSIENKEIMGNKLAVYVIQFDDTGVRIMVPKTNVNVVGLRPIITEAEALGVIEILKDKNVRIDNQTWNRRYREYMEKIKTGSVIEIAQVLRDLFLLQVDKELSFGERSLLGQARSLLLTELTLAGSRENLVNEDQIREIFEL